VPESIEAAEIEPNDTGAPAVAEAPEAADLDNDDFLAPESLFTFRPSARYALFLLVATVVVLMFGMSLAARFDWGSIFFLGVGLVGMVWSGDQVLSRVDLDVTEIRLRRLWRQPKQVAFRQMDSLQAAGRIFSALVFTYHPLQPDGLLDLQSVHTLILPAVEEQELLVELLKARAIHLRMNEQ
jgi:hypothetical protein